MQLSKKPKCFLDIFDSFRKSMLNGFKKKMTLIAYVFPKLRTGKDMVR